MPTESPPTTIRDAVAEVTTRLTRELEKLGHHVAGIFEFADARCEVHLLVDFEGGDDPLGLRVIVDADGSGRPARVTVGWNAGASRVVRWGGCDVVEDFADFGEMAAAVSGDDGA